MGLISAHHELGQDTQAIADVEKMPPATYETALGDPGFLSMLGAIYQQANQFEVAQGLLERAAKLADRRRRPAQRRAAIAAGGHLSAAQQHRSGLRDLPPDSARRIPTAPMPGRASSPRLPPPIATREALAGDRADSRAGAQAARSRHRLRADRGQPLRRHRRHRPRRRVHEPRAGLLRQAQDSSRRPTSTFRTPGCSTTPATTARSIPR